MNHPLELMLKSFQPRQWYEASDLPHPDYVDDLEGALMWVYRELGGVWVVGFYDPGRTWHGESAYNTAEQAAARVRWLNGGK